MGIALSVLLLTVAVIGAVAGIGALLALRLTPRKPVHTVRTVRTRRSDVPTGAAATPAPPRPQHRPHPPKAPATASTRQRDDKANRLAAMHSLLARGDEEHAKVDSTSFADTQAFDDDYPVTMVIPRGAMRAPSPLLNLDAPAPQAPADRARKA